MNANKVLVLGDSGTGKSAALRNFTPEEVLVINAAGKPLPFKNHFETITPRFERLTQDVLQAMDSTDKKVIIIDDAQYIMSFQYMRRIKENGWDKWNDIQGDFFNIIKHCDDLPADTIVYFLSHLQRDDEGHEKVKTMGKMLDEKITIEGLFTIVLKTAVKDGQYMFLTQNSGMDTVKSPIGMFPTYAIDNDLKYVDQKIRNYYEIGDFANDEEIAQLDQEVAKTAVTKETGSDRRRRKRISDNQETTEKEGSGTAAGQGTVSEPAESTKGSTPEEPKEVTSGFTDENKADIPADKTTDAPKHRVRKNRNGETEKEKSAEAPAEETKEETGRKRRRKAVKEPDDFMEIPEEVSDDDVPF